MIFLVYCIASLFYYVFVLSPAPTWYHCPTVMARYSLFVLKVPLNPKQTDRQTSFTFTACLKHFTFSINQRLLCLLACLYRLCDWLPDFLYGISLHFYGHFPGRPVLAGTRMSPFLILLELRMIEVVVTTGAKRHAKLQSKCHHQQTYLTFYTPDTLPIAQPADSNHWREKFSYQLWLIIRFLMLSVFFYF